MSIRGSLTKKKVNWRRKYNIFGNRMKEIKPVEKKVRYVDNMKDVRQVEDCGLYHNLYQMQSILLRSNQLEHEWKDLLP